MARSGNRPGVEPLQEVDDFTWGHGNAGHALAEWGHNVMPSIAITPPGDNETLTQLDVPSLHLTHEYNGHQPNTEQNRESHVPPDTDSSVYLQLLQLAIESRDQLHSLQKPSAPAGASSGSVTETLEATVNACLEHLAGLNVSDDLGASVQDQQMLSEIGGTISVQPQQLNHTTRVEGENKYVPIADTPDPNSHRNNIWAASDFRDICKSLSTLFFEQRDMSKVAEWLSLEVALTPDSCPDKPRLLSDLGGTCMALFETSGERNLIVKAADYLSAAVALTPDGCSDRHALLSNQGKAFMSLFKVFGGQSNVDRAVDCLGLAVTLAPDSHSHRPVQLNDLGNAYILRFQRCGKQVDLERATQCLSLAVSLTPDGHLDKPCRLNDLGIAYMCFFKMFGRQIEIDKAIDCLNMALQDTPDGHPDKATLLSSLGSAYVLLSQTSGSHKDINKAIDCLGQALVLTPDGHPKQPSRLNELGSAYISLFQTLGRQGDIERAAGCLMLAVGLTPNNHPDMPSLLGNLGNIYMLWFLALGRQGDIASAVGYLSRAAEIVPDGHPDKPTLLSNLGNAYMSLFKRFGRQSDIDKAIICLSAAVALTPNGHPAKPYGLGGLGWAYTLLYQASSRQSDISKATECLSMAVSLTPDGHPSKPSWLTYLGNACISLFKTSGRHRDIDKAAECHGLAVVLTLDGHPDKPGRLGSLGYACLLLFEVFGRQNDLDKAIKNLSLAMTLTPDNHPDKSTLLNNLGIAWISLFKKFGRQITIDKATKDLDLAFSITSEGHPDKPGRLNNLGIACMSLFQMFGRQSDIDKAADSFGQTIALTPDDHPSKPHRLSNLGNAHVLLFYTFGRRCDIEKAIECFSSALACIPEGHPNKPAFLIHLGHAYCQSHWRSESLHDVGEALYVFRRAAYMVTGLASERLFASRLWVMLSTYLQLPPLEAHARSMQLLLEAVWLGGSVQDRYSCLEEARGLVTEAAATAIAVRQYDTAVEWLEQGRCMVWTQLLELRTPLDELHDRYPELSNELYRVSQLLKYSPMSLSDEVTLDAARKHRQWATEREQLIESARQLAGFEDFLRPARVAKLALCAHGNTVVVVNVSSKYCDALVIRSNTQRVEHVPLPDFQFDQVLTAHTKLPGQRSFPDTERKPVWYETRSEVAIKEVLSLLWYGIVCPVLGHLGISHVLPIDKLPHIVWCITGPLSFLPVHAAGDYTTGQPETVLHNLAISSYTPNLSVLNRSAIAPGSFSGMLAVGVAAPIRGMTPLAEVKRELDHVEARFKGYRCTRLDDKNASPDAVLQEMESHSWVHFACHASQASRDPLQSAFQLSGAGLDLATISRVPLPHAEFAFLSACLTAAGDAKLPDETVHLAAGLIMAGYRSVIASMWTIYDKHAPVVAEKVYDHMLEDGMPDCGKAAMALHKAMAYLRDTVGAEKYEVWVPYIHMGH